MLSQKTTSTLFGLFIRTALADIILCWPYHPVLAFTRFRIIRRATSHKVNPSRKNEIQYFVGGLRTNSGYTKTRTPSKETGEGTPGLLLYNNRHINATSCRGNAKLTYREGAPADSPFEWSDMFAFILVFVLSMRDFSDNQLRHELQ